MDNTIIYVVGNSLYINLTNRCTNRCEFCVRYYDKPVYGNLWLKDEPTAEYVIDSLEKEWDLSKYKEVVFCGFGEPTYRIEDICTICKYLHGKGKLTRINTNGHGSKIAGRDISAECVSNLDKINISLNATDKEKYDAICHCQYGEDGFDIMLDFAKSCVAAGCNTVLSVVDSIGAEEIEKAKNIAESIGARLKVRELL